MRAHRLVRAAWLLVTFGAALGVTATSGCANILGLRESIDDGDCVLNSDCAPDKRCIFRVCSPQCQSDKDCPATQRCLRTESGAACVDSHGAGCDKTCPAGTICDTTQNVCRNGCNVDSDCLGGQTCLDHVCRGSDTGHDPILPDAGSARDSSVDNATGSGGSSGSGGAGGSGGNAGSGGAGATGGSAGAGGNAGNGGTAGSGAGGATGGAAGAGTAGTGGATGSGGAVGTGGAAGGTGGAAGNGTGGTVVGDGAIDSPSVDVASDTSCNECTLGATRCGVNQGVQTCVTVGACTTWGAEALCGGRKICTGTAPSAACGCAPPPTGCENGTGKFCADANTLVECAKDADQCIYKLSPVTCPAGKPCTGSHPTASCSCATPPTSCMNQQGTFCESGTVVATCGLDTANCLAITNRITCPTGKPCTGAFGAASCSCNAPPTDCGGGAGTACRGAAPGEVVTCGTNTDGCVVITGTAACTAGKPCAGTPPSSACTCPTPPVGCNQAGTNFCQSSTSIATCGLDGDGCLNITGTSSCPANKPCVGGVCTCPAPPAICNGMAGTFCSDASTQVTCAIDGTTGCLGISATTPCGGGKQCTGAAGSATCTCLPPPTDCPTGTGTVCRAGNVLATCGPDGVTGCVVTTGSATCPAGMYCEGAYPSADCSGVCLAGAVQCATTTSVQTCTTAGQWGTATTCPLASPPNPTCLNGKCAYHGGLDQSGAITGTLYATYIYAIRFQAAATTNAFRLGMFGTAAGHNARMAIYSDAGVPMPNALLASTATFATASGAMEAAIATTALTAGSYYWIAAISDTDIGMHVDMGGAGYFANSNTAGWSSLPATFPSGGTLDTSLTPDFYVVLRDQ